MIGDEEDILTLETFEEDALQKASQRAEKAKRKQMRNALTLQTHMPTLPFSHKPAKGVGAQHRLDWGHCAKMNLVDPDVAQFLTEAGPSSSLTQPAEVVLPKKTASRLKEEMKKKQTAGPKWFDMPRGDLSEANRRDLQALQIRGAMDPKQFYKKSDLGKTPPTFFQVPLFILGF